MSVNQEILFLSIEETKKRQLSLSGVFPIGKLSILLSRLDSLSEKKKRRQIDR